MLLVVAAQFYVGVFMTWTQIAISLALLGALGVVIWAVVRRFRGDPIPYDSLLDGPDSTMGGITTQMPDELRHGA